KEAGEVFSQCEIVFLMLINSTAMDEVLARGKEAFSERVRGRLLINMATTSPRYSHTLAADIRAHGGRYVEAPVSGSRQPAEAGKLVAMLAGIPEDVAYVRLLLAPMCRDSIFCGPIPSALYMKLAVNLFVITMVTGLAEAMHFANRLGLDLMKFAEILNGGPMASDASRVKVAKLLAQDFTKQAAVSDVLEVNR